MKQKRIKEVALLLIGIYFLILGILAVISTLTYRNAPTILWMCYFSLIFIGLGTILKKSYFISAQINIIAIPLIIWSIDFYTALITGNSPWGITAYLFSQKIGILNFVSFQHIYTLPLALFVVYLLKAEKTEKFEKEDSWKLSFIEATILFILSIIFTKPLDNINCVFHSCIKQIVLPSYVYQIVWFVAVFLMIFITNFILNKFKILPK